MKNRTFGTVLVVGFIATSSLILFGPTVQIYHAMAQNAKWVGDTTEAGTVIDLDATNGIDVVWHGGKLHLRPDQIAHIAYRLSLTCDPECAQ